MPRFSMYITGLLNVLMYTVWNSVVGDEPY